MPDGSDYPKDQSGLGAASAKLLGTFGKSAPDVPTVIATRRNMGWYQDLQTGVEYCGGMEIAPSMHKR